MKYKTSFK